MARFAVVRNSDDKVMTVFGTTNGLPNGWTPPAGCRSQSLDDTLMIHSGDTLTVGGLWTPAVYDPTEDNRKAAIDAAIQAQTIGTVTPATMYDIGRMTVGQYNSWWNTNVTTAADALPILKAVTFLLVQLAVRWSTMKFN